MGILLESKNIISSSQK